MNGVLHIHKIDRFSFCEISMFSGREFWGGGRLWNHFPPRSAGPEPILLQFLAVLLQIFPCSSTRICKMTLKKKNERKGPRKVIGQLPTLSCLSCLPTGPSQAYFQRVYFAASEAPYNPIHIIVYNDNVESLRHQACLRSFLFNGCPRRWSRV